MKTVFFIFLIGLSTESVGQTKYPKGVYMTMVELQNLRPSQSYNLVLEKRSDGDIAMGGGNEYDVSSPDNAVKGKVIRKEIVAISDGTSLYINGQLFEVQRGYCKITDEGRWLLFKGGVLKNDMDAANATLGPLAGAIAGSHHFAYRLNPADLTIQRVDRFKLEELLKKHEGLSEQFESEKIQRDPDVILKYLAMINK